jgi:hypothetical protein
MTLIISPADLALLNAGKSVAMSPSATPIPPTPVPTPGSSVYANGQFLWAGDWSFAGQPNYSDLVGKPGGKCVGFTVMQPWGGWLPYAPGLKFDTTAYKSLLVSLKPTGTNQKWSAYCVAAGDTPDGHAVDILKYGPAPQQNVWNNYVIPLADMQLTNKMILKFAIQDQTGLASNVWYVDNVGFL